MTLADEGEYGLTWPLKGEFLSQVDYVIKELRNQGYTVKRDFYSDARGEDWDNLIITWDKAR